MFASSFSLEKSLERLSIYQAKSKKVIMFEKTQVSSFEPLQLLQKSLFAQDPGRISKFLQNRLVDLTEYPVTLGYIACSVALILHKSRIFSTCILSIAVV